MSEDYQNWSNKKLHRKLNQAWELAGCARMDHDKTDELRWLNEAEKYQTELRSRK